MRTLSIPDGFIPYVDAALVRFGYLYGLAPVVDGATVQFVGDTLRHDAEREFLYLLYREKIYTETLEIRHALFSACAP